jgi:membrane protein YdbS with pleckstrin-like domain
MSVPESVAKRRFFTIGLLRLAGVVLLAFSVLTVNGNITALSSDIGFVGIVIGIVLMLLVPQMLYARWRTPPEV